MNIAQKSGTFQVLRAADRFARHAERTSSLICLLRNNLQTKNSRDTHVPEGPKVAKNGRFYRVIPAFVHSCTRMVFRGVIRAVRRRQFAVVPAWVSSLIGEACLSWLPISTVYDIYPFLDRIEVDMSTDASSIERFTTKKNSPCGRGQACNDNGKPGVRLLARIQVQDSGRRGYWEERDEEADGFFALSANKPRKKTVSVALA